MYDWVILLHNRNGHDTVNQLHLDKKKKIKEIIKLKKKKNKGNNKVKKKKKMKHHVLSSKHQTGKRRHSDCTESNSGTGHPTCLRDMEGGEE